MLTVQIEHILNCKISILLSDSNIPQSSRGCLGTSSAMCQVTELLFSVDYFIKWLLLLFPENFGESQREVGYFHSFLKATENDSLFKGWTRWFETVKVLITMALAAINTFLEMLWVCVCVWMCSSTDLVMQIMKSAGITGGKAKNLSHLSVNLTFAAFV